MAVAIAAAYFVWSSFDPHAADFKTLYSAGYAVAHPHIPLYDLKELDENPFGQVFKLPPFAAVVLAPLSVFTLQQARMVWRIILVVAHFAAFALVCSAFRFAPLGMPWLATLAVWAAYSPAHIAVGEGQWDTLFLLLLTIGMVGRPAPSAVAVGLAASVKLYPAMWALAFVSARDWRRASIGAVAGLTATLVGIVTVGIDESITYLATVLPASGSITAYPDNQSLAGVVARATIADLKPFPIRDAGWLGLALRVVAIAALAAGLWLCRRSPRRDPIGLALRMGLFATLSILVIPSAWTHYHAILLAPIAAVFADMLDSRVAWLGWGILGATIILTMLPNPAILTGEDLNRALWLRSRADSANSALLRMFPTALDRLVFSYKGLGALLVLGLVAWRLRAAAGR
jgi:hypothetical protein